MKNTKKMVYLSAILVLIAVIVYYHHIHEKGFGSRMLEKIAHVRGLPVYRRRVDGATADKINREIETYYEKTGLESSEKEGWNSKHLSNAFCDQEGDDLPTLSKELTACMKQLCKTHFISPESVTLSAEKDGDSKKFDYWVNLYNIGDYQGPHCHINDGDDTPFYCYTYFSKYTHGLDAPLCFHPNLNDDETVVKPEIRQGDILIFAPTLDHSVERQNREQPRITVSGNIYHDLFRSDGAEMGVEDVGLGNRTVLK